jgi:hypothetical protein
MDSMERTTPETCQFVARAIANSRVESMAGVQVALITSPSPAPAIAFIVERAFGN